MVGSDTNVERIKIRFRYFGNLDRHRSHYSAPIISSQSQWKRWPKSGYSNVCIPNDDDGIKGCSQRYQRSRLALTGATFPELWLNGVTNSRVVSDNWIHQNISVKHCIAHQWNLKFCTFTPPTEIRIWSMMYEWFDLHGILPLLTATKMVLNRLK